MSEQDRNNLKMARAIRDLVIDASEEELQADLAGFGEDLDELASCAHSVVKRALESASTRTAVVSDLHRGLGALIQMLRRRDRLSASELASAAVVDLGELQAIESDPTVAPHPRTIYQLASYFKLPQRSLLVLSGALDVGQNVRDEAVRFAASSRGMSNLSREEKKLLSEFVRFLQEYTDR
jgi:transcriptional regulator with XRE-family HTH domain